MFALQKTLLKDKALDLGVKSLQIISAKIKGYVCRIHRKLSKLYGKKTKIQLENG